MMTRLKPRWLGPLILLALFGLALAAPVSTRVGLLLDLRGAIGPASDDYLGRSLDEAEQRGVELVILRMDTPGGLDTSMRAIIKRILTSNVPVISYVAPGGARAASAGTYILYASHWAAMAPGTNLGAATPVELGGGLPGLERDKDQAPRPEGGPAVAGDAMTKKIVNDAAAYLRGLAELRGRNVEWAERAVREGVSLPATEALAAKVIDLVADDLDQLLRQLHGREVRLPTGNRTLNTQNLELLPLEPDWRNELLSIISDPSLAYVLMLIGIYGLIYEFVSPGAVLPGTLGAICLLLALYAFHLLPVNYTGLGLILLGVALMAVEAFMPSFGAIGVAGISAFLFGSLILIDPQQPAFGIALPLILGLTALSGLVLVLLLSMLVRAQRRPVVSGAEQLVGSLGQALEDFTTAGSVRVQGEIWSAQADQLLRKGQTVRVIGRDGLILRVTSSDAKDQ